MHLDGDRIRHYRARKGMTQEQLAARSGWNPRTIQRAEKGDPIQNRAAAEIAQALEVPLDQIRSLRAASLDANEIRERRADEVILLPCGSGQRLVSTLLKSVFAEVDKDIEPRAENLESLRMFGSVFDRCWANPFSEPHERIPAYSEMETIELMAEANSAISKLVDHGIRVFLGSYDIEHPRIRYEEFGEAYCRTGDKNLILYRKALIVLTEQIEDALFRCPDDHPERASTLDDDVPF
jgi:transcriptional regulator with XRE-family HTH domain